MAEPHPPVVTDVMIVDNETHTSKTVFLEIKGTPLVQARFCTGRIGPSGTLVHYDPTSKAKAVWKHRIRIALQELGIMNFPLFPNRNYNIIVMFHVVNMNKKIDNLLKFVMDDLALVVYSNQSKVMGVTMRKIPAEINEEWTIISVEEEAI